MTDRLLKTKLYIPPLRPNLVPRPRLIARLNQGLQRACKVTLVSAPAGFGKTTLVSKWAAGCRRPVAWLSLDESDNDPSQFLTYVGAALQTVDTSVGAGMLSLLQSRQPLQAEWFLTSLINEIAETPQEFILVLDDYHLIEVRLIHEALTFLLDHLPPQMRLAIASRADPPLPLARLRGRGELTELRAADLRFTPDEAATFLNQVMALDLSAEEVTALETRTEGWIAGLQMAALSMQGRADSARFIQAFTGSHRFVLDYLVEEVLLRQPERVRSCLLQTSILDRLSGPLCDAVTGQEDSKMMLETLERGNLFVVPLDDQRQWYRYHHLFADVLQAHLMEEQPDRVAILHQRASAWYEQNDLLSDAVRHALAAEDFERAADLVELAMPTMRRHRQEATLFGWLKALPDEVVHCRPVLNVAYAWSLLAGGELEAVEARLQDAERCLNAVTDTTVDMRERLEAPAPEKGVAEMVVVEQEEFRRLPATIAIYRAAHAQALGDVPGTAKYARRALDLLAEQDHFWRGAAAALLGLASWASGDLEVAHETFADARVSLERAGYLSDAISGTVILADIRIAQGRLHEAGRIYEQSLQLATEQGEPGLPGTADLYVGMSELQREHDDLDAATQHLLSSKELGEHGGLRENRYRWYVAMARVREAQGDLDSALDLLQEAERHYLRGFFPDVRPVAALKTRLWLAHGRLGEALGWVRKQGLSVDDDLSYLREYEHVTMARVLIARYKSGGTERFIIDAMRLLERLLRAAEEGERTGSVIEILVLQALVHQAQGDISAALVSLERALTLAEPEGYVRIFVDEGPPMAQLLREAAARGIMPDYTGKLLAAFEATEPGSARKSPLPTSPASQPLIEPLSERELEVLRLFSTELSGPEIAHELVIALSTVRTHTKSIYSKLNVNNRRAAVKRAMELDLL